jgi:hypothetical protein
MKTLAEFDRLLPDEDACKKAIMSQRWPDGVVKCPRCGSAKVWAMRSRPFHWVCKSGAQIIDDQTGEILTCAKNGGYRFSIISRTIFENTKIPLKLWFKIGYLILTAKKGISALQLHRVIFGEDSTHAYRTTWYVAMRLRAGMHGDVIPPLGSDGGDVEIDETYIGGLEENKHWDKRIGKAAAHAKKATVIGAIARKGNVICKAVDGLGFKTQEEFVQQAVSTRARLVATDEHPGYRHLKTLGYEHKTVNHKQHQYVVGTVGTNTIESFWSLLKRGILGSYHHVSDAYLPLYLNEFAFRFNHRKDPEMFEKMLQTVER